MATHTKPPFSKDEHLDYLSKPVWIKTTDNRAFMARYAKVGYWYPVDGFGWDISRIPDSDVECWTPVPLPQFLDSK